jgi:hypothetical protein
MAGTGRNAGPWLELIDDLQVETLRKVGPALVIGQGRNSEPGQQLPQPTFEQVLFPRLLQNGCQFAVLVEQGDLLEIVLGRQSRTDHQLPQPVSQGRMIFLIARRVRRIEGRQAVANQGSDLQAVEGIGQIVGIAPRVKVAHGTVNHPDGNFQGA